MTIILKEEKTEKGLVTLSHDGTTYRAELATECGAPDLYRTEKEYKSPDKRKATAAFNRYRREA